MTIKELIEKLQEFDKNLPVLINGYEGGSDDLLKEHVIQRTFIRNGMPSASYYGKHKPIYNEIDLLKTNKDFFDGILLSR